LFEITGISQSDLEIPLSTESWGVFHFYEKTRHIFATEDGHLTFDINSKFESLTCYSNEEILFTLEDNIDILDMKYIVAVIESYCGNIENTKDIERTYKTIGDIEDDNLKCTYDYFIDEIFFKSVSVINKLSN
jgi:hypothetical protein